MNQFWTVLSLNQGGMCLNQSNYSIWIRVVLDLLATLVSVFCLFSLGLETKIIYEKVEKMKQKLQCGSEQYLVAQSHSGSLLVHCLWLLKTLSGEVLCTLDERTFMKWKVKVIMSLSGTLQTKTSSSLKGRCDFSITVWLCSFLLPQIHFCPFQLFIEISLVSFYITWYSKC